MSHITEVEEFHQSGSLGICNFKEVIDRLRDAAAHGIRVDVGLQVSMDGRIWLCVDGMAFIRFKPRIPQMKFGPLGDSQNMLAADVDWLRDVNAELMVRRDELAAETLQLKHTLAQHGITTL